MKNKRYFGIIPAAGRSRRMGTHKLLMPWNEDRVIDTVLRAWSSSVIEHTVIVIRNDDSLLRNACQAYPIEVVLLPQDTADMKATIQAGLNFVAEQWSPNHDDVCLIAPADLPKLNPYLIDSVAKQVDGTQIVTPTYGGKNGHPTGFPWHATRAIFELAQHEGLDALLQRSKTRRIDFDCSLRPRDIDTPEDYQREIQG